MVTRITGSEVPIAEADRRPGDPAALVAPVERAAEFLDWADTDLDETVADAWQFDRQIWMNSSTTSGREKARRPIGGSGRLACSDYL